MSLGQHVCCSVGIVQQHRNLAPDGSGDKSSLCCMLFVNILLATKFLKFSLVLVD